MDRRAPARGTGARSSHRRRGSKSSPRAPTTGPYHLQAILPETDQDNLTFTRSLPLAHATDPASGILIAYEMNGQPLGRDHGAPFRLIVPHWYAVASVKWLKRLDVLTEPYTGEFQTGHYIYQWPDRPHEPVSLMRVRARITDPAPGSTIGLGAYTVRGKAWSGTGPITRVDVSLTGEGDWQPAQLEPSRSGYHWQDWTFTWDTDRRRQTHPAGQSHRRRRQRPTRRPPVEPPGLRQQRHRSHLRRPPMTPLDRQETTWTCSRSTRPSMLRREEAAARLHALADALARNNSVQFERAGRRLTVHVPEEVDLKIEVEIGGDDGNELEIELTW